jgi:hypothetical protein
MDARNFMPRVSRVKFQVSRGGAEKLRVVAAGTLAENVFHAQEGLGVLFHGTAEGFDEFAVALFVLRHEVADGPD